MPTIVVITYSSDLVYEAIYLALSVSKGNDANVRPFSIIIADQWTTGVSSTTTLDMRDKKVP